MADAVSVWEGVGVPLPVEIGVDPVERLPVMEGVRLADLVRVPDFVSETVCKEEALPVPVAVLLKEMEGVTVCVAVMVTLAVTTDVPVPVAVCWLVIDGL